jgi:CheY-like chemotaxis protein
MIAKTILLIEDNPSDVDLTKRALGRCHIPNDLIVAEDGKEAIDYLLGRGIYTERNVAELPALTLLDLKLPRVSGLEVLRQIREDPRTHRLPVVVLTSSKEERDIATSYDLGINSYVRKPIDFKQFVDTIQQLGLYWLNLNEPPPRTK